MSDQIYLNELIKKYKPDQQLPFLFFWGHTPKNKETIDKSCLSQWYPISFTVDNIQYATAEHYMMAQKAKLFHDQEIFEQITQSTDPREVKNLGRLVKNYNDDTWLQHRFKIVVQGNMAKFAQHNALKEFLLHTDEHILVEASPQDRIWGIGLSVDNPDVQNPSQWKGLNLLGFALMQVRDQLKK